MPVYRQTGQCVVRGADGTIACGDWTAANVDQLIEGLTVSEEAEVDEVRDGRNETVNLAFTNVKRTFQIDFIPAAAVDADPAQAPVKNVIANAKSAMALPTIPAKVTLSAFDDTSSATINVTAIYKGGGSLSRTPNGAVKMTLPLERPLSNTTWTTADNAVIALTTQITQA